MRKTVNRKAMVREVLKQLPEGATAEEINRMLPPNIAAREQGKRRLYEPRDIEVVAESMDDVYIDRWNLVGEVYRPVFMLVEVPEDTPRPHMID